MWCVRVKSLVERDLHLGRTDKGTGRGVIVPHNGPGGDDGEDEDEPLGYAETTVLAPPLSWPG